MRPEIRDLLDRIKLTTFKVVLIEDTHSPLKCELAENLLDKEFSFVWNGEEIEVEESCNNLSDQIYCICGKGICDVYHVKLESGEQYKIGNTCISHLYPDFYAAYKVKRKEYIKLRKLTPRNMITYVEKHNMTSNLFIKSICDQYKQKNKITRKQNDALLNNILNHKEGIFQSECGLKDYLDKKLGNSSFHNSLRIQFETKGYLTERQLECIKWPVKK